MRLEILSDEPVGTKCQLCTDASATRFIRYRLDGVVFFRRVCADCRKWLRAQSDATLPNNLRAHKSQDERR